jgi:hypothetical protein
MIPRFGEWFATVGVLIAFLGFLAPQIHGRQLYLAIAFVCVLTLTPRLSRAKRDFDRACLPATPLGRADFFAGLNMGSLPWARPSPSGYFLLSGPQLVLRQPASPSDLTSDEDRERPPPASGSPLTLGNSDDFLAWSRRRENHSTGRTAFKYFTRRSKNGASMAA